MNKLILKAYELVPEAYRQTFKNSKKENEQSHVQFGRIKEQLFGRHLRRKLALIMKKLRLLMLVEEFKR